MFGIGMTELLVIMAVALVVFGPKRLPELARSMGRALGEFRHASADLRQALNETPATPTPPQESAAPAESQDPSATGDAPRSDPPNDDAHHEDLPEDDGHHEDPPEADERAPSAAASPKPDPSA